MGIFDTLFGGGINQVMEEARATQGSVVLDVRSSDEYRSGHIEGAFNVPLGSLDKVRQAVRDLDTPLFVYCLSGSRSSMACRELERMGYTSVVNMGGINRWSGKVVRAGGSR